MLNNFRIVLYSRGGVLFSLHNALRGMDARIVWASNEIRGMHLQGRMLCKIVAGPLICTQEIEGGEQVGDKNSSHEQYRHGLCHLPFITPSISN